MHIFLKEIYDLWYGCIYYFLMPWGKVFPSDLQK